MKKKINLTPETITFRMKRLLKNEDYRLLQDLWFWSWDKAQREGKKHRRSEDWAYIDGFDTAMGMAEKWANKVPKEKIEEEGE